VAGPFDDLLHGRTIGGDRHVGDLPMLAISSDTEAVPIEECDQAEAEQTGAR
jgi:hypothetical protein